MFTNRDILEIVQKSEHFESRLETLRPALEFFRGVDDKTYQKLAEEYTKVSEEYDKWLDEEAECTSL